MALLKGGVAGGEVHQLGGVLVERLGHHGLQLVDFQLRDARTDMAALPRGIADLEGLHLGRELVHELVVDRTVEIHAVVAGADRAAEEELRGDRGFDRLVDFGVRHHEERGLAAEFQADGLDVLRP